MLCVASVEIDADLLAASRDEKVNALYRVYPLAPETDLPAYTFRHGGCLLMKHIGKTFDALTREDKKAWTDQALVRDRIMIRAPMIAPQTPTVGASTSHARVDEGVLA